jgi:hypothetical protein
VHLVTAFLNINHHALVGISSFSSALEMLDLALTVSSRMDRIISTNIRRPSSYCRTIVMMSWCLFLDRILHFDAESLLLVIVILDDINRKQRLSSAERSIAECCLSSTDPQLQMFLSGVADARMISLLRETFGEVKGQSSKHVGTVHERKTNQVFEQVQALVCDPSESRQKNLLSIFVLSCLEPFVFPGGPPQSARASRPRRVLLDKASDANDAQVQLFLSMMGCISDNVEAADPRLLALLYASRVELATQTSKKMCTKEDKPHLWDLTQNITCSNCQKVGCTCRKAYYCSPRVPKTAVGCAQE